MAHQRGFAGPGQAHDAKDFAALHIQADIGDTDNGIEPFQHLGFSQSLGLDRRQGLVGTITKYFPDIRDVDDGAIGLRHWIHPPVV